MAAGWLGRVTRPGEERSGAEAHGEEARSGTMTPALTVYPGYNTFRVCRAIYPAYNCCENGMTVRGRTIWSLIEVVTERRTTLQLLFFEGGS